VFYDRKGSVEKISGREPQGVWRQEELISGNRQSWSNFYSDNPLNKPALTGNLCIPCINAT
jgi:hypothetical protein